MTRRHRLAGVPLDCLSLEQAADLLMAEQAAGRSATQLSVNAAKLRWLQSHPEGRALARQATLCTADGVSILLAGRCAGLPLPGRVTGIDLMEALAARAPRAGHRLALIGGRPGVARRAARRLGQRGVEVILTGHGYRDADGWDVLERELTRLQPEQVYLALPGPLRERLAARWVRSLDASIVIGVGGAFDVIAGDRRRAPRWLRARGLEWAWRWGLEPRRLWRRNLVGGLSFAHALWVGVVDGRPDVAS